MSTNTLEDILKAQEAAIVETFGADKKAFRETFNFRTAKELPEGADWPAVQEPGIDADTGEAIMVTKGYKREAVTSMLYRPSAAQLAAFLQDQCPEQATLLELVEDYIFSEAQKIISANPNMTAEDFPLDKIDLSYLARLPKEIKSRGLDAEELKAFCQDYVDAMVEHAGLDAQRAAFAANIFAKKLAQVKSDRIAQQKLRSYLDIYVAKSPRAEAFQTIVGWLAGKLDEMLAAEIVELGDML